MVDGECTYLFSDEGKMEITNKDPMIMTIVFATPDINQDDISKHNMLISLSDLVRYLWYPLTIHFYATFIKEGCKDVPFDREVYAHMRRETQALVCFIFQYRIVNADRSTILEVFKIK